MVLDTIQDPYIRLDGEFRFTFVNRAAERLLGQPREELAGKTPWDVRPDCAQTPLETGLRAAKAGSVPYSFENYYEPWRRWYAITAVPDAGGLVVHFSDVTDHKRAEEHRRLIFDDSPTGMFRTAPGGRLLAANRSFAEMLHYGSADEMVATISDVAHQLWAKPDDREKVVRMTDEQGFVRGLECEFKCKDGAIVWVSVSGRKVTGPDGGTLHYEGYVEDITQRRERDEALRQAEQVIRHRERQTLHHLRKRGRELCFCSRSNLASSTASSPSTPHSCA